MNSLAHPQVRISQKAKIMALTVALPLLAAWTVQAQFVPGRLAVLRAGDGVMDLHLKQSPIFIDQFDPKAENATPSFTVAIPTNGPNLFFFNGHAATEGNLNRSTDHRLLTFAGYGGGSLLQSNGTPALLNIPRGICTVDASGNIHPYFYKGGFKAEKYNPRGAATDGTNNFWACGNAYGTLFFNPDSAMEPVRFKSFPNSRALRIINNVLYVGMNLSDARTLDEPAGIYKFETASGAPDALPRKDDTVAHLVLPIPEHYAKTVSFDMNQQETIAYMADVAIGIQKYVKTNDVWKFSGNFSIPQNIPDKLNNSKGCFGLVVDFSGPAPILYATTTEGYDGSVNSNRLVRIVDAGPNSPVTTIAQAGNTNIAFRGIDFTPDTGERLSANGAGH
jgi:hypothetical protein